MFKSEVEKSASSLHPALDLFNTNNTVCGVQTSRFTEISLSSAPEIKPYEFRIQNSKAFLDLQRSYILTKYKIVDENGVDVAVEDMTKDAYAPVNLFGCAQFREIQVSINGVLVYDNDNFPYRCFLSALLSYSAEYKNTFLRLAGFSPESKPTAEDDSEYVKRVKACAKSKHMEAITPLFFEPATQSKAILPYVDLRITCFPSSDEFMIDRRKGTSKYKVKILGMSLMLHELHVHDATLVAFDSMLKQRGSITYSSLGTNVRTFHIPGGIKVTILIVALCDIYHCRSSRPLNCSQTTFLAVSFSHLSTLQRTTEISPILLCSRTTPCQVYESRRAVRLCPSTTMP